MAGASTPVRSLHAHTLLHRGKRDPKPQTTPHAAFGAHDMPPQQPVPEPEPTPLAAAAVPAAAVASGAAAAVAAPASTAANHGLGIQGGQSTPPPPKSGFGRKVLLIGAGAYLAGVVVLSQSDEAKAWAWENYPELCKLAAVPKPKSATQQQRPTHTVEVVKSNTVAPAARTTDTPKHPQPIAIAPAVVSAPVALTSSATSPPSPSTKSVIQDPAVKARLEQALAPVASPTPAPATPSRPTSPLAAAFSHPSPRGSVPSSYAAASFIPRTEFDVLLRELALAEAELASFTGSVDTEVVGELLACEDAIRSRTIRHLQTLEADQSHTLRSQIQRQDAAAFQEQYHRHEPEIDEFRSDRELEEENKWRGRLYDALYTQNEKMSELTDGLMQSEEVAKRTHYAGFLSQLRNANDALRDGRLKDLHSRLALARHIELRSKQAHKLSAALLSLSEVIEKNHRGFELPWTVVKDVAKADDTLKKAVELVEPTSVQKGVYSLAALKQAFQAISYDVKRTTFLPDSTDLWTLGREAVAHLFATLTLSETGGVVMPLVADVTGPLKASIGANGAGTFAVDTLHQRTDYAHYINASTYLNANAPELALRELEAMQPSRRAIMARFIEELRKTVQVQEAIRVVRMRVLALNAAAAKA